MARILALIPARGGSKGIPQKNIANLAGKPLLWYSVDAAIKAQIFDAIYVSSDDEQILTVAEKYGAARFCRNPALAQDDSPTNPVIQEFIERQTLSADDVIVLLQPTSPLRTVEHIKAALDIFLQHKACSALKSVCRADSKYLYALTGADPYLTPLLPEYSQIARRQDLPEIYLPNGAIYIFSVASFQKYNAIPQQQVAAFIMSDAESIDIDTPEDLKKAEARLLQPAVLQSQRGLQ